MDDIRKYEPLFGSWTVDRVIGEGSFGKVYALRKTDFGKDYYSALKVITVPQSKSEISSLRSEGMDDQSIRNHFKQFVADVVSEFDLMSRFRGNSNIVSYEDHMLIPSEDGFGYNILIRMELLTSLVHVLEENKFSKKDVIQLGIDMCKALELCQKHDIIHRDIKPENIFVSSNNDYKLGDFGIARTVEKTSGEMSKKGTYTYMAPEVYKGEPYGSDVDLYSLGIVIYRLLNGNRTPFLPPHPTPITHTDRENALLRRISGSRIPTPSGAGGRLAEIVMKAIEYNPKDRFISPMQMRKELEAISYTEGEGQIIYPAGDRIELPPSPSKYASGNPPQSAAGGSVAYPPQEAAGGSVAYPPQGAAEGSVAYPPQGTAGGGAMYPPQGTAGGGAMYPPQGTAGGGAMYPPQGTAGGGAAYPPQGTAGGGAAYPPQGTAGGGAMYPPQDNPPIDLDATVADTSYRSSAHTPVNTPPPTEKRKPWLKWAIIAGAAALVIIAVVVIILVSNSGQPTIEDIYVKTTGNIETPGSATPPTPIDTDTQEPPTPSPTPTASDTPTPTPTPTPEPTPTPTPTPTPEPTPTPTPTPEPTPTPTPATTTGGISGKVFDDINNDNYITIEIGKYYEVYSGISICITEIGPTMTDDGDLYIAVGVMIDNSSSYVIELEAEDFVCAAYHDELFDDFKTATLTINEDEQIISYPITINIGESKLIMLGYKIPVNSDFAIFAYTNIWDSVSNGESYLYFISE